MSITGHIGTIEMADFTVVTTVLMITGTPKAGVVVLWITSTTHATRVFSITVTNEFRTIVTKPICMAPEEIITV